MTRSSSNWRTYQTMIYTPRDIRVLYALWGIKYMTTTQLCTLFWRESSQNSLYALKSCQRRLRQLEAYGVIRRIPQAAKRGEGSKPDLFKLAAKSVSLLAYECGVEPKTVDITVWADEELNPKIKHILATTDVRIAFLQACQTSGCTLEEWRDESALRNDPMIDTVPIATAQGEEIQITLIPDVRLTLSRHGKQGIYRLEVDRATIELEASHEQKRSIAQKLRRYLLLEESASYREQYGTRPLRVLWAVKGERRLQNMMQVASRVIQQVVASPEAMPTNEPLKLGEVPKDTEFTRLAKRFLFTTLEHIKSRNVLTDPIWQVAGSPPQALLE